MSTSSQATDHPGAVEATAGQPGAVEATAGQPGAGEATAEMASGQRVRLRAEDAEDLAIIAALLQDARIPLKEMVFQPGEDRFMAAFTRYRRERLPDPTDCRGLTECPAALVFDCIREVKHRNIDTADLDQELVLLTIATEPGRQHLFHIDLVFDGDREIQLRTDCIDCRLDDFGDPVTSATTPCDHLTEFDVALLRESVADAGKA